MRVRKDRRLDAGDMGEAEGAREEAGGATKGIGDDRGRTERSELTEREPDPNKRTNKCNAEAGRKGQAKRKGRKERREE